MLQHEAANNLHLTHAHHSPAAAVTGEQSHQVGSPRSDPFVRKPLWVIALEEEQGVHRGLTTSQADNGSIRQTPTHLPRHLSLLDLVSVGVGGTIGSGVFVLCGMIARDYAGPATCVSWVISGVAAFLSGCCYAELSGRIPSAGSSYAYAYVSMGELPAFITASMLTLEFLVSGSAVARSWGDKVVEWLKVEMDAGVWVSKYLDPGYGFNPMAFLVSAVTSSLVFSGVKESKIVTDVFTWLKVFLVAFMAVGGLLLLDTSNLKPFVPPEFGVSGIMRGATSSFFGYLGYDGICCMAGEAKNPTFNLPLSLMITLVLVTILYIVAAFSLTGMQHYTKISPESGFPEAFAARGVEWAAQLTAAGELITLPVVVLLSPVLQPRLLYALSMDGLLPSMFSEVNAEGNPRKGILFSGGFMTLFAAFVPFTYLDDFVSAGILVAFAVTNSSLILLRHESPEGQPLLLEKQLFFTNFLSFIASLIARHGSDSAVGWSVASCFLLLTVVLGFQIAWSCPQSSVFGGRSAGTPNDSRKYFRTPLMPFIPLLGNFANWYLVAQLSFLGIFLLLLYVSLAGVLYFVYGAKHSVGNSGRWRSGNYEVTPELEASDEDYTSDTGHETDTDTLPCDMQEKLIV